MPKKDADSYLVFPSGLTVARAKQVAKKYKKSDGLRQHEALDRVARENGLDMSWQDAIRYLRNALSNETRRTYIVLKNIDIAGLTYWITDDVHDQDSGCSGAGYANLTELMEDALDGIVLGKVMIADLTDMGQSAIERTIEEFAALVAEKAIKGEDYPLINQ